MKKQIQSDHNNVTCSYPFPENCVTQVLKANIYFKKWTAGIYKFKRIQVVQSIEINKIISGTAFIYQMPTFLST